MIVSKLRFAMESILLTILYICGTTNNNNYNLYRNIDIDNIDLTGIST